MIEVNQRFEQFSVAISALFKYIQQIETKEMEKFGLKGSFAPYLLTLSKYEGGLSATELAKICNKDKAAISRAVREMAEKDLICRQEGASYRARLRLTEQGREMATFVKSRADAAVYAADEGLTEEQREAFYQTIRLLTANLKRISQQGIPE